MKRETVEARWQEGDLIDVKLREGGKTTFRVAQIGAFYFVTPLLDTVSFASIEKVKIIQGQPGLRLLSAALIWGGIGYFAIDQVNNLILTGGNRQFNADVARTSLAMAATGVALRLAKRKYYPLRKRRLMTVTPTSPLYRTGTRR